MKRKFFISLPKEVLSFSFAKFNKCWFGHYLFEEVKNFPTSIAIIMAINS